MTKGDAIVEINTLASSRNRVEILRLLRARGEVGKQELRDAFDVSRPTLQRNLATLEDAGWIRSTQSGYSLTVAGKLVEEPFSNLVETVETATKLQPLLRWIPDAHLDLDLGLLANADITVLEPSNPYAPANRFVEKLQQTREFRAFMGVVARDGTEQVWRRVASGEMTVELILTPDAAETFQTDPSFVEFTSELLASDRFDLHIHDADIPFFLGLLDDEILIGVEDADGIPQALAISKNPAVAGWANETFDRYLSRSRPLT